MNIISIDPSLTSTAVCVNGEKFFIYTPEKNAYNKSGLKSWFKKIEHLINIRTIPVPKYDTYAEEQISKLETYQKVVDMIINDIKSCVDVCEETIIAIEGYSYSSSVGPIIDLVTFSTLLRSELRKHVSSNLKVFSPKNVKLEVCKLVYPPTIKKEGKRVIREVIEYRNYDGVAGGHFTKTEILKAINESSWSDKWTKYVKDNFVELSEVKNVPKPHEDFNDSIVLYHIVISELNLIK